MHLALSAKALALQFALLSSVLLVAQCHPIQGAKETGTDANPAVKYLLGPELPHIDNPGRMIGAASMVADSEDEENHDRVRFVNGVEAPDGKHISHPSLPQEPCRIRKFFSRVGLVKPQLPPVREDGERSKEARHIEKDRAIWLNPARPVIHDVGSKEEGSKKTIGKRWSVWPDWYDFWYDLGDGKPNEFPIQITLVNASPYAWRRGYSHSYQMRDWESIWPERVAPGESIRVTSKVKPSWSKMDSAAEVAYHLEGTSKPMSFMVERRSGRGRPNNVFIRFLQNLRTVNTPKGGEMQLDWHDWPGGAQWILAGTEGDFTSMDVAVDWMAKQLPEIGHLPLREIVMPRSHHAGMYKNGARKFGMGSPANSITQTENITFQLETGGARIFDIRPFLIEDDNVGYRVYESHGTIVGGQWHGMHGASLAEMVGMVNDFNRRYPGELIIWDVHPSQAMSRKDVKSRVKHMEEPERGILYHEFKALKNRLAVPDDEDLTHWPLERFIANRTSAVLIRVPEGWAKDDEFPGGREGFVTTRTFPVRQAWTNNELTQDLVPEQIRELREAKPKRGSRLFFADWVLTQKGIDLILSSQPLVVASIITYKALFTEYWTALSMERYPNWLALDGIHSNEPKSYVVALNHCLAARRCGNIMPFAKKTPLNHTPGFEHRPELTHFGFDWVNSEENVRKKEEAEAKARQDEKKRRKEW
ncbi:hypothetical protein ACJ41O_005033 [Fusarium nematophilum]